MRYRPFFLLGFLWTAALVAGETQLLDGFDTGQTRWGKGALAESAQIKQGNAALRWSPDSGPLERNDLQVDFGQFRTVRFWLHANAATFARIRFSAGGKSLVFKIDWTGWTQMELPEWRFNEDAEPGVRFEQVEAGFEQTVLIIDGLEQTSEWARIQINENEELIDWMYWGAKTRHLWTIVEKSGEGGLEPFWSWGTFWLKETGGRDMLVAERKFDMDIALYGTLEVRVANDNNGWLSVHLQIDGAWSTPVSFKKGSSRFDEIEIPLPEGARVLDAVRLDFSEPTDNVGGSTGRELKCNLHWLMLRKRGAPIGDPVPGIGPITPVPLNGTLEKNGLPGGIYFGREDLTRIRTLFQEGVGKPLFAKIIDRAEGWLRTEPEAFVGRYNPQSNWVVARKNKQTGNLAQCAQECALAFVLTGEKKYADHARRTLLSLCRIEEWTDGPFARFPRGWGGYGNPFTEGSVTYAAGLAFDWAYPAFSNTEREEIQQAILHKGVWWTYDRLKHSPGMMKMNQGIVFDSEIGCALIVLAALDPKLKPMLAETAEWVWQGVNAYALPDGASTEGVGYWNYTWNSAVKYLAALGQRDPVAFGERCSDNVRRSMDWLAHMKSNAEERWQPVAVCDSRGAAPRGAVAALFAKFIKNSTAAWFQSWDPNPPDELAAFLWEHDTPVKEPQTRLAALFPQAGYVFLRQGFEYGDVLLGLLVTPRLAGHYQHDQGAFMLEAFGNYLAMDPGMISYANPIHRSLSDSRLHNTVTIDGRDTIRNNQTITRFFTSPSLDVVSADLTSGYPEAKRVVRYALFLRPDHVIIADEVELKEPGRIEWNLNSEGALTLTDTRVLARARNSTLVADFAEPAELTLETEEWPCTYSGLTNHHGTLSALEPVTDQRFLVSLYPVRRDQEASVQVERIKEGPASGLHISRDDTEELVIWNPGQAIATHGIVSDAAMAFVRRSNGSIEAVAMVQGTTLTVDGQQWLQTAAPDTASIELHEQWTVLATASGNPATAPLLDERHWSLQMTMGGSGGDIMDVRTHRSEDPQVGAWCIYAASADTVPALRTRPEDIPQVTVETDEELDGKNDTSLESVPEHVTFRLTPFPETLPLNKVTLHLDGRTLPPDVFSVTRDKETVGVQTAVKGMLSPSDWAPEFFTTHTLDMETQFGCLPPRPVRGIYRFGIRPKAAGDALFLSDVTDDATGGPRLVSVFAHGGLKRDRPYSGDRIRLNGIDFPKGLTTHPENKGAMAYAELVYDLGKGARKPQRFCAIVGVQTGSPGTVEFIVATRKKGEDWQERLHTKPLGESSQAVTVNIDLTDADQLRLYVTDAGDGIGSDHAVWAMARFE